MADPDQAFGQGRQSYREGAEKVFTYLNTPSSLWQSLGFTQTWLSFADQESSSFCWLNCAIFQGINTVINAFYII